MFGLEETKDLYRSSGFRSQIRLLHAQEERHHGEHHKKGIMADLFAVNMDVDSPQQMRRLLKVSVNRKNTYTSM